MGPYEGRLGKYKSENGAVCEITPIIHEYLEKKSGQYWCEQDAKVCF
jgi:hypothetical protein